MSFKFDVAQLEQSAQLWDEVVLDAAQRALVRDLGTAVGEKLGIDPIPCRGMWLQAVRDWQHAHGQHAVRIGEMPPRERLRAAFEIKDHFLQRAHVMLRDPGEKAQVTQAVDAAYELYMSKYNRR